MKDTLISVGVVVAILLSAYAALSGGGVPSFGAAGGLLAENYWPYLLYNDGYKSEREIVLSGANGDITTGDDLTVTDDATVSGGVLNVTTTNLATSTATIGCVQTYATSTASPIRLGFDLSATTTAKNQYGTTVGGFVSWGFGSCPF